MRIALIANDTRGGVQPYLALGQGLQRAGHEVRVVAPSGFAAMVAGAGLPHAPLSGDVQAEVAQAAGVGEKGLVATLRLMQRELPRQLRTGLRETLAACDGVDVLMGGVGGMVSGVSVAEKLGRPFLEAHLHPLGVPTDAYPGVLLPWVPRGPGGWGWRLAHRASEVMLWAPFERALGPARAEVLGLSGRPRATDGQPVLYGFSPRVVPLPTGGLRPRHVTGYWTLPAAPSWRPPEGLEAFLGRARPVVSIGFGSMTSLDPERLAAEVTAAVRRAGVRAVLLTGWGGLQALSGDDVFVTDAVPHDWLFERVDAVVHHGGAGTTGAAIRAGVPAVVVPFTVDQPFWASRVQALGVGPRPIPRSRLDAESLARALRGAVTDRAMVARAARLGEEVRAEDGVASAVAVVDALASRQGWPQPSRT